MGVFFLDYMGKNLEPPPSPTHPLASEPGHKSTLLKLSCHWIPYKKNNMIPEPQITTSLG